MAAVLTLRLGTFKWRDKRVLDIECLGTLLALDTECWIYDFVGAEDVAVSLVALCSSAGDRLWLVDAKGMSK